MNGILDAAVAVHRRLAELDLRYCLIGGIALQRWGEPRTTLDVDVTVIAEFGSEAPLVDRLIEAFSPRISDAAAFALQSRVLLLQTNDRIGIDVSLGALPFEEQMIERSTL